MTFATAEAEIGFTETVLLVNEGGSVDVCLQLTGVLQAPVLVNITAILVTAEGKWRNGFNYFHYEGDLT